MAASEDVHRLTQRATMHYARNQIMITSDVFISEYGRFRIRDLNAIYVGVEPLSAVERVEGVIGTAATLVLVGAAVDAGSAVGYLVAAGIVPVWMFALALVLRSPRTYELSARHHGMQVTLLRTSDQVEFGRVRRALIRALESARDSDPAGFGTATSARTPGNPVTQSNLQARLSAARQDSPKPVDPRPPDEPAADPPRTAAKTVPPGLIDDAFAQYDELLLRVGPPPGWPASEGRNR